MMNLWLDLRFSARTLRRSPALTSIAVLTLAVGIGANTAIFSIVNAVLLRPLPYAEPDRLVQVWERHPENGLNSVSPINMRDLAESAATLTSVGQYGYETPTLIEGVNVEPLGAVAVTSQFFDVLGMAPARGRVLRAEDDRPDAAPVVVLSDGFWRRRYGADPDIVGRSIRLDGIAHEVVGVMPEAFAFPSGDLDLWMPLRIDYAVLSRGNHFLFGIARLGAGVTHAAAQEEATRIAARLADEYPDTNAQVGFGLVPLHEQLTGEERPALLALMAAVAFVLLIACTNVANLLVTRAAGRTGEVAVRRALGAGRSRLLGQFLMEGALLAAIGGVAGCLVAVWGVDALSRMAGGDLDGAAVDARVLGFTAGLLVAIGLAMGLAQALVFARTDAAQGIRAGGRGAVNGRTRHRVRSTLAGAQLALAVPLLVGAALLLRTVGALRSVPTGFEAEGVITVRLELPESRYAEPERQLAFTSGALERIRGIPGVVAAGMTSDLPFSGSRMTSSFEIEGRAQSVGGREPTADLRLVTTDYFRALEIGVRQGRGFEATDRAGSARVAVVNETFARFFFPGEDPIGQRFINRGRPTEIVGVVADVHHDDLRADPPPEFYLSMEQNPSRRLFVAVRVQGDPATFAGSVRAATLAVDPLLPPTSVRTMRERLDRFMAPQRFTFRLLAIFACVAMLLAAMGLYGVIAYAVSQRRRELGIRMALGADRREILGLVLGDGARVIVVGLASGIIAALVVARLLSSMLFGVAPADPLSFTAVATLLALVAVAACWLPAVRAARTDPMEVLRYE